MGLVGGAEVVLERLIFPVLPALMLWQKSYISDVQAWLIPESRG